MAEELVFVTELGGRLVLFPYGVGKGCGYEIDRATPNRYPYWTITAYGLPRIRVMVNDEATQLKLLKLPRNRHS